MGRLIDACEVVWKINHAIEQVGKASETAAENEGFQTTIKAYKDVRDAIMREPTAEPEIIRCKECKHLQKWRSEESVKKFGQIYECARNVLDCPKPEEFCSHAERRADG